MVPQSDRTLSAAMRTNRTLTESFLNLSAYMALRAYMIFYFFILMTISFLGKKYPGRINSLDGVERICDVRSGMYQ